MTRTPEDLDEIRKAVGTWLEIKADNRLLLTAPTSADAHHSALLERLLQGQLPLSYPPPLKFSYPWYSLVEKGHGEAFEVWAPNELQANVDPSLEGRLVIDQYTGWTIVAVSISPSEKREWRVWRVTYDRDPWKRIWSVTPGRLAHGHQFWNLQRLPETGT